MGSIVKICKKHGELTEEDCYICFNKKSNKYSFVCKKCRLYANRKYYNKNPSKAIKRRVKWRKENKERDTETNKIWREANKENLKKYNREYHLKNKRKLNSRSRKHNRELSLYTSYNHKISWCEETRRDPENEELLQVRCTESSCRKWFNPTNMQVKDRLNTLLNKNARGENRFYCSEECKKNCSIYRQSKYLKGFVIERDKRHDQNEWAQMVKERDNYKCQICGSVDDLIAHHIEGIYENPLMSADLDLGITVCKNCHERIHKDTGCTYVDLRQDNLCRGD